MAQWGQGFQYSAQTGFNPQQPQFQQGFQQPGLAPQPTGFPGQRPPGFQQPQPTGFPGIQQPQQTGFGLQQGGFQPQQTGFQGLQPQQTGFQPSAFQRRPAPPPPPVPPIPSQFQQQNAQPSGFLGVGGQSRFANPSPSPLAAQPTGYMGGGGLQPLMPQMTGFIDPRLQMMSSTFLPANPTAPYNPAGAPQLQQQPLGGMSLQQSFQQHNQNQRGTAAPKVPWALSKAEKKSYDQIFRAWDTRGEGFITGQTALEVFGQSGLDKNDLAKIWALADVDNRGKLNLAEFHVAMGIIYRKLNGNEIPDELPEELIPPSHRDLDTSVNFLKDILKNDTRARSPSNFDNGPVSKLKERSFNSTSAPGAGGRQDATVYKHSDDAPPGGFYQSRYRTVDRSAIRTASESNSPSSELSDLKRQLENTAQMLDRTAEESASRTKEDEELDREMSDLKYRVKRLQEDLDYVSKGPRTTGKDEERRRLERELLTLMHERLPELERRIQDRDERKKREQREWNRDRDRRNDKFGRFDDRDDRYSSSRYDRDDDRDRSYRSYDRDDRDRDRDRERDRYRDYDRDRPYSQNRDRDYERPSSPPATRSPPPPPPAAPPASTLSRPPPAPTPAKSPAPAVKKMTPEERKAFMQAEAQRRIQERMAALGVTPSGSATPKLDTTVEDRLAKEKQEAEEKAKAAEREAEERERVRRERLQGEKALKETSAPNTPVSAAPAAPTPPAPRAPPSALKAKAPAPPPPRKAPAARPPVAIRTPSVSTPPVAQVPAVAPAPPPPAPPPAPVPSVPEVDHEEEAIRAREAALRKAREDRLERLRKMEEEEAEAAKRLEEEFQARRKQFMTPPVAVPQPPSPAPPPPAPVVVSPPPAPVMSPPVAPTPPAPPVASPPATGSPPVDKAKTNPFSRMMKEGSTPGAASTPPATNGSTNPFFKSQAATSPAVAPPTLSAPPPTKSPAPPAIKTSYHTAPESESDWEDAAEKEVDDSSEDELDSSRDTRNRLAQHLFGSILPPSRPQSTAPAPSAPSQSSTPAPPAAPAAPMIDPSSYGAPPPPPPPPVAPPAPAGPAMAAPAPSGDRNALFSAIQSGARLRKAQTNDRSIPPVSGKVLGDTAPPEHINATPRPASPPSPKESFTMPPPLGLTDMNGSARSNRESVGWFAGLAADEGVPHHDRLGSMAEEEEPEAQTAVPQIHVDAAQETSHDNDLMQDIDMSTEHRVRSLYAYEGQRAEDLSFGENLMLTAHPSKSGGDWWYGTVVRDGKSGFFPKSYVQEVEKVKAVALYDYEGSNPDELPFAEGDELTIVDRVEVDWWKAEQSGVVFIVPAAYLQIIDVSPLTPRPRVVSLDTSATLRPGSTEISRPTSMHSETGMVADDEASDWDSADDDEDEDDTSDADTSFMSTESSNASEEEEDEEEQTEEQRRTDREARELERQRVLEAAGLIIMRSDRKPPPRPARRKSTRKRRPAPAVPDRRRHSRRPSKDLPDVPGSESHESITRLDDAYERYEAYKKSSANLNRLSLASVDTVNSTISPASSVPSLRSTSADQENRSHSHFLHFFGRKTPGNDGETRTMPVISAPILDKDSALSMSSEGDFGTSWASLVDKSALEEIPSKERRRQEAIFELITTEAAYVRDLQLIVEIFYTSLLPLLDEKAVAVIFANVEDILLTNTTFLSSLEERQRDCRLYIDHIGDVLTHNVANMGVYMEYCVNQGTAIKVLQSLRQSNPELAACLQRLRDDPVVRSLDLSSYLLVPMQRITRYPLLIKQILHHSEVGDERRQVEQALETSEKLLQHINETIREQEGRERLRTISKDLWIGGGRLDLTAPTRNMGPRKLLKEGGLMKAKSGRRLRAFLCSDILILTDEGAKALYRVPIPIAEVQVKEVSGLTVGLSGRDDLVFQLVLAYPRGGDKINLRANSARDCQLWMQAIESASRACRKADKKAQRRR